MRPTLHLKKLSTLARHIGTGIIALPLEEIRVDGLQSVLTIEIYEDTSTLGCVAGSRFKYLQQVLNQAGCAIHTSAMQGNNMCCVGLMIDREGGLTFTLQSGNALPIAAAAARPPGPPPAMATSTFATCFIPLSLTTQESGVGRHTKITSAKRFFVCGNRLHTGLGEASVLLELIQPASPRAIREPRP